MPAPRFIRHFRARPRLILSIALGLVGFFAQRHFPLTSELTDHTRAAISIDAGALLFLISTWIMMKRSSTERMQRHARQQDEGAKTIMVLVMGGIMFSIAIIIMEMHGAKDLPFDRMLLHLCLAVLTILCTWFVTHMLFALHYAHAYYIGHKGMDFHDGRNPDYSDFFYQSITIAVTGATSDVEITSPIIRRITLIHCIISFFLNMVVLGMTINIVAGLI